ncbi:MAG: hypothetical protein HQK61_09920, partial [Desulfamplus sp.]|nr:hypothetical protein [Desulfamplus sp.]
MDFINKKRVCKCILIITCIFSFILVKQQICLAESGEDDPDHNPSTIRERVEFGSTPNPVGAGARAMGMGGAFISIADDATAASWNPAGLIQLELPEVSVVGAFTSRSDGYSYESFPDASSDQRISSTALNYLSAAFPFQMFNRNIVISLNYQHMYEFDKMVCLDYQNAFQGDSPYDPDNPDTLGYYEYTESSHREYDQDGALYSVSPAFALQITPALSMGFTINFWKNFLMDNRWRTVNVIERSTVGDFTYDIYNKYIDIYDFDGINFNAGFLWNLNNSLTVGGVFKSPFKADIDHTFEWYDSSGDVDSYKWSESLEMPMSYGVAVALRVSDVLSFAFDLYRTHWEDYLLNTPSGKKTSPITSLSEDESNIEPATQIRLGMEYLKMLKKTIVPFRCGLFYDPEPAGGHLDEFWGVSLGTGFLYQQFVFDIAWQYRFGSDVRGVSFPGINTTQD